MKSKELNLKLLEYVPELQKLFDSVTEWQDGIDTGSTIVVEDVLMVYLKSCLKNDDKDAVQKCSNYIEWLSDHYDDEYAGDVLVISIFEYIHFAEDRSQLELALGPKAMQKYNSIDWSK